VWLLRLCVSTLCYKLYNPTTRGYACIRNRCCWGSSARLRNSKSCALRRTDTVSPSRSVQLSAVDIIYSYPSTFAQICPVRAPRGAYASQIPLIHDIQFLGSYLYIRLKTWLLEGAMIPLPRAILRCHCVAALNDYVPALLSSLKVCDCPALYCSLTSHAETKCKAIAYPICMSVS
jgi:hypothetical protein